MPLEKWQRYTLHSPCPICGGYGAYKKEKRCKGFLLLDGFSAYCQNAESAVSLSVNGLLLYKHQLEEHQQYSIPAIPSPSALNTVAYGHDIPLRRAKSSQELGLPAASKTRAAGSRSPKKKRSRAGQLPTPERGNHQNTGSEVRQLLVEEVSHPEQGRYRPAVTKTWYVVVEGEREIMRSLKREVAEMFMS